MIDPEAQLEDKERAYLVMLASSEGFPVLQRIFQYECEKFKVDLINASTPEQVLLKHNLAKSAAMFYAAVIQRINLEIEMYENTVRFDDEPKDITSGIIDLGDESEEEHVRG